MTQTEDNKTPQPVPLNRFPHLHLKQTPTKGRGVFASQKIETGTILDVSPVLILDPVENTTHIERTSLYHYTYNWPLQTTAGATVKTQAVVFGLGSMFNHSNLRQNVVWQRDLEGEVIVYRALRDVDAGEELCISYGAHLTFKDADEAEETEREDVEEELGRIEIGG